MPKPKKVTKKKAPAKKKTAPKKGRVLTREEALKMLKRNQFSIVSQ